MIDKDAQLAILADALTKIVEVATIGTATTTPSLSYWRELAIWLLRPWSSPRVMGRCRRRPHSLRPPKHCGRPRVRRHSINGRRLCDPRFSPLSGYILLLEIPGSRRVSTSYLRISRELFALEHLN